MYSVYVTGKNVIEFYISHLLFIQNIIIYLWHLIQMLTSFINATTYSFKMIPWIFSDLFSV